ncbi:MAG: hypothetical protein IJO74_02480 [Clostridia bacterium]|nr:hypothetical protein [Clostridia bacterium]
MEINKNQLDKITSLSDSEFSQKLKTALDNAGASPEVIQRMGENIPLLKQTLRSLSQKDLENILQKMDRQTIDDIKKSLEE